MAIYTSEQIKAGGSVGGYVSTSSDGYTVDGYQIGGNDQYDAWVDFTLPQGYSSYKNCSVTFTFYARYGPTSWDDMDRICIVHFKLTRNGSALINQDIWHLEPSEFIGGSNRRCTFTLDIDDIESVTFLPGDILRFTFDGVDGRFISGSHCLYLSYAVLTSPNAVQINPVIPGVPSNALKRADTGYPLYYEGYVAITNAASLIGSTHDLYIEQTDLKTYYDVYHFPDTNKGDVEIGGVWFFRVRLSTSQDLTANPRTVIYNSDCPYRYPGKVYITTA